MTALPSLFSRWLQQHNAVEFVEKLLEFSDAAVYVIDGDGQILLWSRGLEKLTGIAGADMLGKAHAGLLAQAVSATSGISQHLALTADSAYAQTLQVFNDDWGLFAGALALVQAKPLEPVSPSSSFYGILTCDPIMLEALRIIRNVAETEATVLIRGESGTGKELVAHALHLQSRRCQQPFLAINCAALTPSLLESELFGHVKGAFTGALRSHAGLFQRSDGGTLFLDEVAELPLELQAKLLRVLQEQSFIPVGGDAAVKVDVRIIAATHRSLRAAVKAGLFREDLMYRLRVVPVYLPPLRERPLDVELLLWHNIRQHNLHGYRHIDSIAPQVLKLLLVHAWPGNVRELQNVIAYAFAVGRGTQLSLADLPPEFREQRPEPAMAGSTAGWRQPLDEAAIIRAALQAAPDNLEHAAQHAGMSRATFWRKRKKYGI